MNKPHITINRKAYKSNLLTDWICCWLIAIGILIAMRQLFRFDNPLTSIMIRSAIVIGMITLLTRRWWIAPIVLVLATGIVGFYVISTGTMAIIIAYIKGLIAWWINLFPYASNYNTPQTIELVQWLITIAVCFIVFIIIRAYNYHISSFFIIIILTGVLFVVIGINGFHKNLEALSFISAGTFPLLIRSYCRKTSRRLDKVLFSKRRIMILGLIICSICAIFAHYIVPENTSSWKNAKLSNMANRIERSFNGLDSIGDTPFTIYSSGLQPNQNHLGGDLSLGHKPMLLVKTKNPCLMKGMVYSHYTGSGWEKGDCIEYPFDNYSVLWDVFDVNSIRPNPLRKYTSNTETEVTLLHGGYSLFSCGHVHKLTPEDIDQPLFFNSCTELFSKQQLSRKYSYQFSSLLLNRKNKSLANTIRSLEKESKGDYSQEYLMINQKQYLDLPKNLPASIENKAKNIVKGISSTYARMEELKKYLRSEYEYTLTPGDVPEGVDFVEYFLNTGKGYCVYYASAMAVMARTLNVPSRFVIGYGLKPSGDNWKAYSDTAHAWVECYIYGVGWIPFDPTAPLDYTMMTDSKISPNHHTEETANTTKTTTSAPSVPKATSPSSTTIKIHQEKSSVSILWVAVIIGIAFILLLSAALLKVVKQKSAFDFANMRSRYSNNADCADHYYTDILRQLELLELAPRIGETIYQHGVRIKESLNYPPDADTQSCGDIIIKSFDIIMNWRYGNKSPTVEQLKIIAKTHTELERRLRNKLSPIRYFLVRLLFAK